MYKSGTLTQAELRAAQARAAEARARLLERREAVSKSAGTELLGDLNKELVTLTITIAENEARLEYLDVRLSGLSKALVLVDELEQLQASAARARRQLDEAETQYQSLAHQIATAPSLVVNVQWTDPVIEPAGAPRQPGGGGGGGGLFGGGNRGALGGKEDGQ
jgi:chromosome segregation ATPase